MLQKINDYIENMAYIHQPRNLYDPVEYILSLGGKRIRPLLLMMSYALYKDDVDSVLPQAVGLEMLHSSTLLHDDLIDNANIRRGQDTIHRKWGANTAILSGDCMLAMSFKLMQQCSADKLSEVMDTFTNTTIEICEGQQYDMDFESRSEVSDAEYIEMIRLKTGVLLACAVKIGAILADAPRSDISLLYEFGLNMGIAFQLQDDYLDVYGNPMVLGKNTGNDIIENKKTFMLIRALRLAEGDDKTVLHQWVSSTSFDKQEKTDAITNLYGKLGIDQMAMALIDNYYKLAVEALRTVQVAESKKQSLYDYITR